MIDKKKRNKIITALFQPFEPVDDDVVTQKPIQLTDEQIEYARKHFDWI